MYALTQAGLFPAGFPRTVIPIELGLSLVLVVGWHSLPWGEGSVAVQGLPDVWRWLRVNGKAIWEVALRYYGPLAAALVIFMLGSQILFQTPLPLSGQIKQWWGTLPNTVYGYRDSITIFLGITNNSNLGAWGLAANLFLDAERYLQNLLHFHVSSLILAVPLALAFIIPLALDFRALANRGTRLLIVPVFVACFFTFAYYKATGYIGTRSWYWIAQMICLALFAVVWVQACFDLLRRHHAPYLVWGTAALVSLLLIVANLRALDKLIPAQVAPPADNNPGDIVRLEQITEPGSVIGSTGGGSLAYFIHDRTIVNLDGLMNSTRYFNLMKTCQASVYLDEIGLKYVYGTGYMLTESDPYRCNLGPHLKQIGMIGNGVLYAYIPSAADPTQPVDNQ
jgi:hypothetical protein